MSIPTKNPLEVHVKNFGLILAVALSFLLVHFIKSAGPDFKGVFDFTDSAKALRLTIVTSEIVKQGEIQFQINNRSNFKYSDLLLKCDHMSNSGSKIITTDVTLHETFDYSSSMNVALRNLATPEEATHISCRAIDLKVISELTCYVPAKADSANKIKCLESEI